MPKQLEGIILAAGESRRMGYPKPLLKIAGQTFIERIAESMLAQAAGASAIARATGLSRQTIYRIEADPAGQEAALAVWGK